MIFSYDFNKYFMKDIEEKKRDSLGRASSDRPNIIFERNKQILKMKCANLKNYVANFTTFNNF